jgi:hypothetical protein
MTFTPWRNIETAAVLADRSRKQRLPPEAEFTRSPPDRKTARTSPPKDNPLPSFPPTTPAGFSFSPMRLTLGP